MLYTMMQVCKETGMTYQALKFYCNEGLIPMSSGTRTTAASLTSGTLRGSKVSPVSKNAA